MDIDPSSNCTSLPKIRSVDDATQKQALNSLEQQISVTNSSNQDRELMNAPSLNRKDCQGRHEASGSHRGDIVNAIEEQVCSDGY
jgi:hypothetical protein